MVQKRFPSKISIIIPVFNEESTIKQLTTAVKEASVLGLTKEIIIVDDGSTDATRKILKQSLFKNFHVILLSRNFGKGYALRQGIKKATGDIILIQDADLEYSPIDFPKLIKPFIENSALAVFGSRELRKRNKPSYFSFYLGGKLVTATANLLFGSNLSDVPTGYKLIDSKLLRSLPLTCKRFEFCPEVTAHLLKRKIFIHEVPINYHARSIEEGKKIRARDGIQAIWTLLRLRFG